MHLGFAGGRRARSAAFGLVAAAVFCAGLAGGFATWSGRRAALPGPSAGGQDARPRAAAVGLDLSPPGGVGTPAPGSVSAATAGRTGEPPSRVASDGHGRPTNIDLPLATSPRATSSAPPGPAARFVGLPRFAPGLVVHVPILMYHRIVPWASAGRSLHGLVVPPDRFAAQMHVLAAAGWHTITAADLAADLVAGRRPPPRTFVITLDDGWYDGYRYALPILRRHGFVATFYVVSGRAGERTALSPAKLRTLAGLGMEIGDHTVSHADLPFRSALRASFEIVHAADQIDALVGVRPSTLAYPYGGRSSRDQRLVAEAGFALALTTVGGCVESASNQFSVPRLRVDPGTTPTALLASVQRCWARDRAPPVAARPVSRSGSTHRLQVPARRSTARLPAPTSRVIVARRRVSAR